MQTLSSSLPASKLLPEHLQGPSQGSCYRDPRSEVPTHPKSAFSFMSPPKLLVRRTGAEEVNIWKRLEERVGYYCGILLWPRQETLCQPTFSPEPQSSC